MLFRLSPVAYETTRHWARRAKAQLALAPACEAERCGAETGVHAHHLTHATLGEEEPRHDLITLCDGCHRRAQKLGRELGRVPQRDEIVGLDPRRPLFEPADIAALKAKYLSESFERKESVGALGGHPHCFGRSSTWTAAARPTELASSHLIGA